MFLNWLFILIMTRCTQRASLHHWTVRLWQYRQISAQWECFDGRYWTVLLHIPTVDVTKAIFFRYTELEIHLCNVFLQVM